MRCPTRAASRAIADGGPGRRASVFAFLSDCSGQEQRRLGQVAKELCQRVVGSFSWCARGGRAKAGRVTATPSRQQ